MSSAVKAKLTTKVMTNWMILTTSMGFQALRKEGVPKAFEGTRKAAPATDTRFANGRRLARQMRQPTASAAKTKQRYKKRSNCKHKKSGCVCFIVARLHASALRNRDTGDNKALCAPTDPTAKLRIHARTRKTHRNKNRNIFQHRTIHRTKRGGKKQDCPTITTNKGTFLHLLPHSSRRRVIQFVRTSYGSHSRPRAFTRIQPFFDYCLHHSPPPSIPIRMWQLGVKTLHLFAVHRHHPKRETQLIDFSAAKPLRFGGSTWVNFCIFPLSPEPSPISH